MFAGLRRRLPITPGADRIGHNRMMPILADSAPSSLPRMRQWGRATPEEIASLPEALRGEFQFGDRRMNLIEASARYREATNPLLRTQSPVHRIYKDPRLNMYASLSDAGQDITFATRNPTVNSIQRRRSYSDEQSGLLDSVLAKHAASQPLTPDEVNAALDTASYEVLSPREYRDRLKLYAPEKAETYIPVLPSPDTKPMMQAFVQHLHSPEGRAMLTNTPLQGLERGRAAIYRRYGFQDSPASFQQILDNRANASDRFYQDLYGTFDSRVPPEGAVARVPAPEGGRVDVANYRHYLGQLPPEERQQALANIVKNRRALRQHLGGSTDSATRIRERALGPDGLNVDADYVPLADYSLEDLIQSLGGISDTPPPLMTQSEPMVAANAIDILNEVTPTGAARGAPGPNYSEPFYRTEDLSQYMARPPRHSSRPEYWGL